MAPTLVKLESLRIKRTNRVVWIIFLAFFVYGKTTLEQSTKRLEEVMNALMFGYQPMDLNWKERR